MILVEIIWLSESKCTMNKEKQKLYKGTNDSRAFLVICIMSMLLLHITFSKLAPVNLVELRLILIKKLTKYPWANLWWGPSLEQSSVLPSSLYKLRSFQERIWHAVSAQFYLPRYQQVMCFSGLAQVWIHAFLCYQSFYVFHSSLKCPNRRIKRELKDAVLY